MLCSRDPVSLSFRNSQNNLAHLTISPSFTCCIVSRGGFFPHNPFNPGSTIPTEENIFYHFNLTYVELPYYMLFRRAYMLPIIYKGSWQSEDILLWVSSVTGLRLPLPGCVAALDALAHEARTASVDEIKGRLLPEFKRLTSLRRFINSDTVHFYLVVAENLIRLGPSYLAKESTRLKKLVDSEVSDDQKARLKKRLNILTQFLPPKQVHFVKKTEL